MRRPAIGRLLATVTHVDGPLDTPCWITSMFKAPNGYARMFVDYGLPVGYCHRVAYEALVGPIPEGYHLDHLCRVHACVNPAHLEAVTPRENSLRGINPNWVAHRTDTCHKGHPLTGDNVRYNPQSGTRVCRSCRQEYMKQYWERRKAEAVAS